MNYFIYTAQRCSSGTTLLELTFLLFADYLATLPAVPLVNGSTLSLIAEVSPVREHLCSFYVISIFCTRVRHTHSPAKNAIFPLRSKITF